MQLQLQPGETILWSNRITHGLFVKTHELEYITNLKVGILAPARNVDAQMLLSEIADVVVVNQHWESNYQHMAVSTGYNTRVSMGHSYGGGHMVGDVEILNHQGQPQISYLQIADPASIKSLIKTEMKIK